MLSLYAGKNEWTNFASNISGRTYVALEGQTPSKKHVALILYVTCNLTGGPLYKRQHVYCSFKTLLQTLTMWCFHLTVALSTHCRDGSATTDPHKWINITPLLLILQLQICWPSILAELQPARWRILKTIGWLQDPLDSSMDQSELCACYSLLACGHNSWFLWPVDIWRKLLLLLK